MLHVCLIIFTAYVTFIALLVLLMTEKQPPAIRWLVGMTVIFSTAMLMLTIASPPWFQ